MQARNSNNAQGIDVSHYQGDVDFDLVRSAGLSFVLIKATEGSHGVDDKFARNVAGAKAAGLVVGAYHFCRAISPADAVGEADNFLSVVASVGGVDLIAVDVETPEGGSRQNIVSSARAWVEHVKQATGIQPMLYTYPSFVDEYLDESLADIPLWYASYSEGAPRDRGGWTRWAFLQYAKKGSVQGVAGPVDMDEFDGTEEELRYMGKPTISVDDANKVIGLLQEAYKQGVTKITLPDGTVVAVDQDEIHRLANVQRAASGQPEE